MPLPRVWPARAFDGGGKLSIGFEKLIIFKALAADCVGELLIVHVVFTW